MAIHFLNSNLTKQKRICQSDGPWLISETGERLFDVWLGSGTLILGHPRVGDTTTDPKIDMLPYGPVMTEEFDLLLANTVSFQIGAVGFQTSGSSAISRACRYARAATGRKKIAVFSSFWHGSEDEFLFKDNKMQISTGLSPEVFDRVGYFKNIDEFFNEDLDQYAAVLIEPYQGSQPDIALPKFFTVDKRNLLRKRGVLIIADEVITGFRECYGSCSAARSVNPDIVVFGKAAALGFPVGIVVVSKMVTDQCEQQPFWGGTFSASPTQIERVWDSLRKLSTFEFSTLKINHQSIVDYLSSGLETFEELKYLKLIKGELFSRIVLKSDSVVSARGFIGKSHSGLTAIQEALLRLNVFVGSNGLIFSSTHNLTEMMRLR